MLGKNRTFSSTNWENEHYFETLSALTLKIRNFEWKTGTVRSGTSESKSTLTMPASHSVISVDLQGSLTAQKRACMLLSIYYPMVISCNTFGVATSPNVADLSISFNGMNLNTWSCPWSSLFWHSVRWLSGALNEHYLKFWALNRALNAEKTRDAQSTKSKFYEH